MSRTRLAVITSGAIMALTAAACGSSSAYSASATASAPAPKAAVASASTLRTASVTVGGSKKTIIVNSSGRTVYMLTGDSSKHPLCDSAGCLGAWPAVTSAHPTGKGISGKLGIWKHNGISQVTLGGHPLYVFSGDSGPGTAKGEGLSSFGGTWYVLSSKGSAVTATASATINQPASSSSGTSSSGAGGTGGGW